MISPLSNPDIPRGTKLRTDRPERIPLDDGDCLVRNDIVAAEIGSSERGLNRTDADGAPFTYVGGVKYRPERGFRKYLASKVQRRGQPPKHRGGSK
jgi:hypothetical protein